ncbi:MAG: hypothetical protein HYT76_02450 [Deltaproteobacteria bacterium]|nr:hypothetical protein [Deltaproteobacteria bacterium]
MAQPSLDIIEDKLMKVIWGAVFAGLTTSCIVKEALDDGESQVSPEGELDCHEPNVFSNFNLPAETIYFPVVFQRVTRSDGTGGYSATDFLENLSGLNQTFKPMRIQFFLEETVNLPDDSIYEIDLDEGREESLERIRSYFIDGALSLFIVDQITGPALAYTLGHYGFIAEESANSVTWTHEIGHCFGLLHTHMPGGDFIPDTPDDPGPLWVNENGCVASDNCETVECSPVEGEIPQPDFRNFMSYYPDICKDHFTPNQQQVIWCSAENSLQRFFE